MNRKQAAQCHPLPSINRRPATFAKSRLHSTQIIQTLRNVFSPTCLSKPRLFVVSVFQDTGHNTNRAAKVWSYSGSHVMNSCIQSKRIFSSFNQSSKYFSNSASWHSSHKKTLTPCNKRSSARAFPQDSHRLQNIRVNPHHGRDLGTAQFVWNHKRTITRMTTNMLQNAFRFVSLVKN